MTFNEAKITFSQTYDSKTKTYGDKTKEVVLDKDEQKLHDQRESAKRDREALKNKIPVNKMDKIFGSKTVINELNKIFVGKEYATYYREPEGNYCSGPYSPPKFGDYKKITGLEYKGLKRTQEYRWSVKYETLYIVNIEGGEKIVLEISFVKDEDGWDIFVNDNGRMKPRIQRITSLSKVLNKFANASVITESQYFNY